MISEQQLPQVKGATVVDGDGDKIGKAGQVYLDDTTGKPSWVTVDTGLFGTNESFVPLADVDLEGDRLTVRYDKSRVEGAPNVESDGHIEPAEEAELYRYYGLPDPHDVGPDTDPMPAPTTAVDHGHDTTGDHDHGTAAGLGHDDDRSSGGDRDDAGDTHGASRDHDLSSGTTSGDVAQGRDDGNSTSGTGTSGPGGGSGRRLRRYLVTEQQTVTVPVEREVVQLEGEPAPANSRPLDD